MNLDVFKGDGFSMIELTKAINLIPYLPTRIGSLGIFSPQPISTTSIQVEMQGEVLTMVPAATRGAPGQPVTQLRRNLRTLSTVHLPQVVSVNADEVQNLRAFGSDSEVETAMGLLTRRMAIGRRRLDLTIEYQRIGAIKGQVIDADGSTVLLDLFSTFGVTQQTESFVLGTDSTKVLQKILAAKRMMEDELGGVMYTGIRALCSASFFDAFTSHPAVIAAYQYWSTNSFMRQDNRAGFEFGGVVWEEYRGKVGAIPFIEDGSAYLVPEGVPDLFTTNYAPANYMDTVNTPGLPYYAQMESMDFNKGVNVETQSNPLSWCSRPRAIVKATVA